MDWKLLQDEPDLLAALEHCSAKDKAAELVVLAQEVVDKPCQAEGCSFKKNDIRDPRAAWFQSRFVHAISDPDVALEVVRAAFKLIDTNNDHLLSRIEVIKALRESVVVRLLLQLPQNIRQQDGTREEFEQIFQKIDTTSSKEISLEKFEEHFFFTKHSSREEFYRKKSWFKGATNVDVGSHRADRRHSAGAAVWGMPGGPNRGKPDTDSTDPTPPGPTPSIPKPQIKEDGVCSGCGIS